MTVGRAILDKGASYIGRIQYTQDNRRSDTLENLAGDCSGFTKGLYKPLMDIGDWTGAQCTSPLGRNITNNKADILAGTGMQDADLIFLGWRTDHRPGYAFSHVGLWDAANRRILDQYGDLPPFVRLPYDGRKHGQGPDWHSISAYLDRCDRVLVRRFLPDETPTSGPRPAPVTVTTSGTLEVDGGLGPATISDLQIRFGTPVDGRISKGYSPLVAAMQTFLNSKGYSLTVDGRGLGSNIGVRFPTPSPAYPNGRSKTVDALQGYLGTTRDGVLTAYVPGVSRSLAVAEMQRRLNAGTF